LQPQRLALAESQGERDNPTCPIALLERSGEEQLDLGDRVWFHFQIVNSGGLGKLSRVPSHVPTANRLIECRPNRSVDLVHPSRTHRSAASRRQLEHADIKLFKMLRLQGRQAVSADAED